MTGSNVTVATAASVSSNYSWLPFALMTVVFWGLYGITLHSGTMAFDPKTDPNARYKAFLFVGIAYFIIAVLAPVFMIVRSGSSWQFFSNVGGVSWSLVAGVVGALGAFCALLALARSNNNPAVVMSIIFAGAPVVNAIVALILHPPKTLPWPFVLGILLAALGGFLVTFYKPAPPPQSAPIIAASDNQVRH